MLISEEPASRSRVRPAFDSPKRLDRLIQAGLTKITAAGLLKHRTPARSISSARNNQARTAPVVSKLLQMSKHSALSGIGRVIRQSAMHFVFGDKVLHKPRRYLTPFSGRVRVVKRVVHSLVQERRDERHCADILI
jgi:hypothetical protein